MEITNLELKHLVNELQFLNGGTVDSIYNKDKMLVVGISQQGRYNINVSPECIFLTEKAKTNEVTEFAMMLRKYLKGKKIESITQHNFDRLIEIWTAENVLILELDNANYVLCDRSYRIIRPREFQKFEDRTVATNEVYLYPKSLDIREINAFKKMLKSDEPVIQLLDRYFGSYSRDILTLAKVDKNKAASELTSDEITKIKGNVNLLVFGKKKPQIIYRDGKADLLLFDLDTREFDRKKYFTSYAEALERFLAIEQVMNSRSLNKKAKLIKKKKRKKLKRIKKRGRR